MRILIVRLSSMGDVVQTLPAITDAAKAIRDIEIDWAVDRAFSEIPRWHRAIKQVIASPKRNLANLPGAPFREFLHQLRQERYDQVIDVQGHWKSASVARFARGELHGYDARSVNEWGAHLFYKYKYSVNKAQHSIVRMRRLFSLALDYSFDDQVLDYGIDRSRLPAESVQLKSPYLVFIHSTSWDSKCWPESYWRDLTALAIASGFHVLLPWGTLAECERAKRISGDRKEAVVLPDLTISQKAAVIQRASATVGLDTGLSHVAGALGVPSVTIYGPTDPDLAGAKGDNQIRLASTFECVKCHRSNCHYTGHSSVKPACFSVMEPNDVWGAVVKMLTPLQ